MHKYDYNTKLKYSLAPEIVSMLSFIHEYGASNRIEGIYTADKRLRELVKKNYTPRTRSKQEIADCREVLLTIYWIHDYIRIRPNIILRLHKRPCSLVGRLGGFWKNTNNIIAETDETGNETLRFLSVPSHSALVAIKESCSVFNKANEKNEIARLILITMFILDLLCIYPFNDGNGRMSRLLILLLFYHAGHIV
jgi:Fic family protein